MLALIQHCSARCELKGPNVSVSNFCFGSWPRDNATEEVWGGLDRSVAAQRGRFEHIFPISVWKQSWCALRILNGFEDAQPATLGRLRRPSPRSAA